MQSQKLSTFVKMIQNHGDVLIYLNSEESDQIGEGFL